MSKVVHTQNIYALDAFNMLKMYVSLYVQMHENV